MLGRARYLSLRSQSLISSRGIHNSVSALEMLGALGAGIAVSTLSLRAQIWMEDRSKHTPRVEVKPALLTTQFQMPKPTNHPSRLSLPEIEILRLSSINLSSFLAQEMYSDALQCLKEFQNRNSKLQAGIDSKTANNAPIELIIMLMKMCDPSYTDNVRVLQVLEQRTLMAFKLSEPNRKICEDFIDSARKGWEITQR